MRFRPSIQSSSSSFWNAAELAQIVRDDRRTDREGVRGDQGTRYGVDASQMASLLTRAGGEAGFGAHGLHSLRHSSGTRMYRQTRDLLMVRDHLRHSSVADSDRYAKADGRLEQIVADW